jgi:hypothetical protein
VSQLTAQQLAERRSYDVGYKSNQKEHSQVAETSEESA